MDVAEGTKPGTLPVVKGNGFSLLETTVAVAITAVAAGGLLFALTAFGKYGAHQMGPNREAAAELAEQTLRIAADAWKYGSPGTGPDGSSSIAGTSVTASVVPIDSQSANVTVTVRYTPDPGHADSGTMTISGVVSQKAPPPGARIVRPGLIPIPSGAP